MMDLSRRELVTGVAAAMVAAGLVKLDHATAQVLGPAAQATPMVTLHWLDTTARPTAGAIGTVPWPRGTLSATTSLRVTTANGIPVPSQSTPLAYWPDGSVKWTAHALLPGMAADTQYKVTPGDASQPEHPLVIRESADTIDIDTGTIACTIAKKGSTLLDKVVRKGRTTLSAGRLVCQLQDSPDAGALRSFSSVIEKAAIETSGSVRAVIKVEGLHADEAGKSVLPFVVRLYFTAGSDEIRIVHTFVYDVDEQKNFIRGIGVRFDVPMTDALHDRHIRFTGEDSGVFAEAIRGITGLRRDPGAQVRKAQIDGVVTPPPTEWEAVAPNLNLIPAWGDYTLTQLCADGFQIRKRTREGYGWIAAGAGRRSGGTGFIGGASGGVSFGIRDFWQKHPAQIDIRNAQTELAQVTLWLWAPDAQPMDLRFYHDGMGQDTYAKQTLGLDTTYEDYEPGYASPFGIARTSELSLQILSTTPTRKALAEYADAIQTPALLVCDSQCYLGAEVFGKLWTLPDKSTPAKSLIEDELEFYLNRYLKEIDQRSWYGFWDYGDVRHAYDTDRHVWKYDIGGFAWDNSELSTDLWLWYSYLRTGRADIFRMAEAMTRHTGEVDVYHIGPRKGLGTRHGVQHWGDSSKQTRISSALYRRPYYYLTGDERVGDLMRYQLTEGETWLTNDVERKLPGRRRPQPARQAAPWGAMAWGELAAAWFTEVERTQDTELRDKLLASLKSTAALKHGFFTDHCTMNLDSGVVTSNSDEIYLEHLTACFGLPEICAELARTYGDQVPAFVDAWAQYGELYNGTPAERSRVLGVPGGKVSAKVSMADAHSRCMAFTAWHRKDPTLAQRAWRDWLGRKSPEQRKANLVTRRFAGPDVLNPIEEAQMSTNEAAQFGLSTIQNLALIGQYLGSVEQ